jgi:UDP-N-acetylglucosamine--N-acetylmuramyl-(pentapeptide) pyrophosphoryl-undecaprenol N-acetylglucosamine transferase
MIAAGGTGGHLFPAMAVAEQIKKLTFGEAEFIFIGNPDRLESQIVPSKGYEFIPIRITGLKKEISKDSLLLPFRIINAVMKCRSLIRKRGIDGVIAAGAYLSYPPGLAAKLSGIPLFLFESNVNPGKTNLALSGIAKYIFTSFDESRNYFNPGIHPKLRPYGNPVRMMLSENISKEDARVKFGLDPAKRTILIFGGSLGARSINNAVAVNMEAFSSTEYQYIWQTGKNFEKPGSMPENVKAMEFIDDMGSAYSAADLVVSRSGATTIAELCQMALPSVLVPLPWAATNEQYNNAKVLEEHGGALIVPDAEIGIKLFDTIANLMSDTGMLDHMGRSAGSLARPDAAERCAKEILSMIVPE